MEILKAMTMRPAEMVNGLIFRGMCTLTKVPCVVEVVHNKNGKYYACFMDIDHVGAGLKLGADEGCDIICDYEQIVPATMGATWKIIVDVLNYYNKEDGIDRVLTL